MKRGPYNTKRWQSQNKRRSELIVRDVREGNLTEAERKELQELEAIADKRADQYPDPSVEIVMRHKAL